MGNAESSHADYPISTDGESHEPGSSAGGSLGGGRRGGDLGSFPGAALLDKIPCGNINDTHQEGGYGIKTPSTVRSHLPTPNGSAKSTLQKFFNQAEALCVASPNSAADTGTARSEFFDDEYEDFAYNKKQVAKDESPSSKKKTSPVAAIQLRLLNRLNNNLEVTNSRHLVVVVRHQRCSLEPL